MAANSIPAHANEDGRTKTNIRHHPALNLQNAGPSFLAGHLTDPAGIDRDVCTSSYALYRCNLSAVAEWVIS